MASVPTTLLVDLDGLQALAVDLHAVGTTMSETCDGFAAVDALAVGAATVLDAVDDLTAAWRRHAETLSDTAASLWLGVDRAIREYSGCEREAAGLVGRNDIPNMGPG